MALRRRLACLAATGVLVAMAGGICAEQGEAAAAAASLDFRSDWRFAKGDHPGAEQSEFDDSHWTPVRLPHDWAIAGPFDANAPSGSSGKLPWKGVGWYRKEFELNRPVGDTAPHDRVYLDFDGVMAFPQVYVNGQLAGSWDYGYTPFRIDVTPFVNLQGRNVVAVRVDTTRHGTRWYPGAGIYRKVTMELRRAVHLAHWGVFVTTPTVTDARAEVAVQTAVENNGDQPAAVSLEWMILNPDGDEQARGAQELKLAPGSETVTATLAVERPRRWDVDDQRSTRSAP
jgi:beta-galactosidase